MEKENMCFIKSKFVLCNLGLKSMGVLILNLFPPWFHIYWPSLNPITISKGLQNVDFFLEISSMLFFSHWFLQFLEQNKTSQQDFNKHGTFLFTFVENAETIQGDQNLDIPYILNFCKMENQFIIQDISAYPLQA